MNMQAMKVSELSEVALDWAVAKCQGCHPKRLEDAEMWKHVRQQGAFRYSTDWAQGGPIIEREKISVGYERNSAPQGCLWDAVKPGGTALYLEYGPTPLIAAMRCYVASTLGDTVEIPDGL